MRATFLAHPGVSVKVREGWAHDEKAFTMLIAGPQGPQRLPPLCISIACQTGVGIVTCQAKSGATVRRREWVCTSPKWGKLTMLLDKRIVNRRKGVWIKTEPGCAKLRCFHGLPWRSRHALLSFYLCHCCHSASVP